MRPSILPSPGARARRATAVRRTDSSCSALIRALSSPAASKTGMQVSKRLSNALAIALTALGLVLTVSAILAMLEGRAEAVSNLWLLAGAAACPFLVFQCFRAAVAFVRSGPATLSWGSLRVLLILFVVVWTGVLVWGQPFHEVRAHMALGVWIGAFSAVLTFERRLLAAIPRKALRVADLVLTNLCIAAIGAEVAVRAIGNLSPSPFLARNMDTAVDRIANHRLAPGSARFGYVTNSRGHYDSEFPVPPHDGKVIASIGDSFSASSVPLPFHFTKVLEDRLVDTRVCNFGVPGIGPREYHYILANEALPLEPDLILVNVFVGNDVVDSHLGQRRNSFLRAWFDQGNVLIHLLPPRIVNLLRADPSSIPPVIVQTREELHEILPWLRDPMLDPPGFSEEAFLDAEHRRARHLLFTDAQYAPLFHWLTQIREAAGEIPLVVALIPDEFQVEEDLWEQVRALVRGDLERFRHQRIIGAWLEEHGIAYLDLLPQLRSVEPLADGRRHVYRLRNTHLNVRGNEVAGVSLADLLVERFGFRKRPEVKDR